MTVGRLDALWLVGVAFAWGASFVFPQTEKWFGFGFIDSGNVIRFDSLTAYTVHICRLPVARDGYLVQTRAGGPHEINLFEQAVLGLALLGLHW